MVQSTTETQYKTVIDECRAIFRKKTSDYGTSWRVYRPISVADQLYIKAKRIRNLQEGVIPRVKEGDRDEYMGVVNYSIIGVIQLQLKDDEWDLPASEAVRLYDEVVRHARTLLDNKNHDYGEAWRDMDIKSITDIILAKILRIRQIINNDGKTAISEGIESNYFDILNYAVFALILGKASNADRS